QRQSTESGEEAAAAAGGGDLRRAHGGHPTGPLSPVWRWPRAGLRRQREWSPGSGYAVHRWPRYRRWYGGQGMAGGAPVENLKSECAEARIRMDVKGGRVPEEGRRGHPNGKDPFVPGNASGRAVLDWSPAKGDSTTWFS